MTIFLYIYNENSLIWALIVLLMNILLKESNTMRVDKLIRCELDGIFRRKNISYLPGSAQRVHHLIWWYILNLNWLVWYYPFSIQDYAKQSIRRESDLRIVFILESYCAVWVSYQNYQGKETSSVCLFGYHHPQHLCGDNVFVKSFVFSSRHGNQSLVWKPVDRKGIRFVCLHLQRFVCLHLQIFVCLHLQMQNIIDNDLNVTM